MGRSIPKHTYRLRLGEDGAGSARDIEFEAESADAALRMVQQLCGRRRAQLFENGQKLADIRLSAPHGFWIIGNQVPS
jgi:hypothetical protein